MRDGQIGGDAVDSVANVFPRLSLWQKNRFKVVHFCCFAHLVLKTGFSPPNNVPVLMTRHSVKINR